MIRSYHFSIRGRDHIKYEMPCHDFSLTAEITPSWQMALVADGVGSCLHAEIASKIAAETAAELIKKQFPAYSDDQEAYLAVIFSAMSGAANAVEEYVEKNDPGNIFEYQTTLALAVMSNKSLYYGNAGDSGIIALDDSGIYHLMAKKQNDESGSVFSIPAHRRFETGKADFRPAAVFCMTDGVYDYVAPSIYQSCEYKVDVPFAKIFSAGLLETDIGEKSEVEIMENLEDKEIDAGSELEQCKERAIRFLQSDVCENMRDDLSVAALINRDSGLLESDIKWEKPELDYYSMKWKELKIYPSENLRHELFRDFIHERNPDWTEDDVRDFFEKYLKEKGQKDISTE